MRVDTDRSPLKISAYLEDIKFPCSRENLLGCAEENNAPDLILDAIEDLPQKRFNGVWEILANLQSYNWSPTHKGVRNGRHKGNWIRNV